MVRRACDVWDEDCAGKMEANLVLQRRAVEDGDIEGFHDLDYQFHKLICDLGGNSMMIETIQSYKAKIDRLCLLSLEETSEASDLVNDHQQIADALSAHKMQDAEQVVRFHLSRLHDTVRNQAPHGTQHTAAWPGTATPAPLLWRLAGVLLMVCLLLWLRQRRLNHGAA